MNVNYVQLLILKKRPKIQKKDVDEIKSKKTFFKKTFQLSTLS